MFYSYQWLDIDIVKEDTVKAIICSLVLLWFSLFLYWALWVFFSPPPPFFSFSFPRKQTSIPHCSQYFFPCLYFKSSEVSETYHPQRQSARQGKSVAETLQRVLFEMFHCCVFSDDWGQRDHWWKTGVGRHLPLVSITLLGSVGYWASSGKVDLTYCFFCHCMAMNTFSCFYLLSTFGT